MDGRRLSRACLIALVALAPCAAQARQHRATFLFLGEDGEIRQETLSDVRYVYVERRLLNVEADESESPQAAPLPFRDRPVRRRALLMQESRISFNLIRALEFTYRGTGTAGTEELVLRLTMTDGSERDVPSSSLLGFGSFTPPYLEGKTQEDGKVMRFELPPFRRAASKAGLGLEKVLFHHGARR